MGPSGPPIEQLQLERRCWNEEHVPERLGPCEGSRVRQTPEEGRRTYQLKRCGNNNKDEDNSPKTLNDKNHINVLIL